MIKVVRSESESESESEIQEIKTIREEPLLK
jgi:hypothetical protein